MEHSNPLPDRSQGCSPNTSWTARDPPAISSPSIARRHDTVSQQTRRLQLRNAGFRGPILPSRRISPTFGSCPPDPFNKPVNNENSPLKADKRTLYGEDMPPSPVSILQEIHNSTKRKRQAIRPGITNIFQDHTASEAISEAGSTSWYNEQSNCSPVSFTTSPANMMKLREGSLNQKTPPPLSSPLAKHVKGRNLSRLNLRSTSFEASKYIEHLESQLTALNAKLDSLVSPNTNKARAAKLRALTVETRSLRHELADWERNFSERVNEGVRERLGLESGLKAQIQTLADDGEIKDMRIKELEFEVETLRLKTKDTEALEITNANLEKRIDVLTSLLVQSPTKLEFGSATSSPGKVDPRKRTQRPRSMMPRVPSSPGGVRLSLNAVSESSFWQGRGLRSDSISEAPEDTGDCVDECVRCSLGPAANDHSPDSDSVTSPSSHSVPSSSSRPTSLHSSSSLGATSWGLPFHTEKDMATKSTNRQRRMRRFPSGSCSLKPLILPNNAAATPSLPVAAPVCLPSDAARRDVSNFSLDPTTAFLSQHDFTSPISTPTQPGRRGSTTWAQDQALRALEGRFGSPGEQVEETVFESSPATVEEKLSAALRAASDEQVHRKSRPKSLEEELKKAFLDADATSFSGDFTDGLIPVDESSIKVADAPPSGKVNARTDSILIDVDTRSPLPKNQPRQRHVNIEDDNTPKPHKKPILINSPSKALPSTALATRSAFGLFSRLTEIIAQVWFLGLGLVLGPRFRKKDSKADVEAGEENRMDKRFDWRPYEARASRRRTAECFLRRERKTGQLEPPQGNFGPQQTDTGLEPHIFPCDDCVEPSSRRTLRLWFQFSLTIVLAVGIAIKHGPGTLLVERPRPPPPPPPLAGSSRLVNSAKREAKVGSSDEQSEQRGFTAVAGIRQQREQLGIRPVTFAQILGPADFEGPGSPRTSTHHWPS
ncbi:MAG: hypothetical protein Q9195_007546 [Heterodermia aff. obscurata]